MAFGALFLARLCLTLVVIEVCTMLYKVLCKENGLQEANGRANEETGCRTGVFLSSDDDCCSLNHSKPIEILWSLRLSDSTPTPLRQRRSGCSLYFFVIGKTVCKYGHRTLHVRSRICAFRRNIT